MLARAHARAWPLTWASARRRQSDTKYEWRYHALASRALPAFCVTSVRPDESHLNDAHVPESHHRTLWHGLFTTTASLTAPREASAPRSPRGIAYHMANGVAPMPRIMHAGIMPRAKHSGECGEVRDMWRAPRAAFKPQPQPGRRLSARPAFAAPSQSTEPLVSGGWVARPCVPRLPAASRHARALSQASFDRGPMLRLGQAVAQHSSARCAHVRGRGRVRHCPVPPSRYARPPALETLPARLSERVRNHKAHSRSGRAPIALGFIDGYMMGACPGADPGGGGAKALPGGGGACDPRGGAPRPPPMLLPPPPPSPPAWERAHHSLSETPLMLSFLWSADAASSAALRSVKVTMAQRRSVIILISLTCEERARSGVRVREGAQWRARERGRAAVCA